MKTTGIKVIAGLFFAGMLSACGDMMPIWKDAPKVPAPDNYQQSELTFSSVYTRVFRPKCIGCHGNGGGVSLGTYGSVIKNIERIRQSTVVERRMPKSPGSSISTHDLGLLNAWILAGAPEGASGEEPAPLGPAFQSIRFHILETKCWSCHAPGKPVARIPLVTTEDLLNSPLELVIPGNPEESGLVLAITSADPRKIMPPPKDAAGSPTGYVPLKDEEIQAIVGWIQAGAKD